MDDAGYLLIEAGTSKTKFQEFLLQVRLLTMFTVKPLHQQGQAVWLL